MRTAEDVESLARLGVLSITLPPEKPSKRYKRSVKTPPIYELVDEGDKGVKS